MNKFEESHECKFTASYGIKMEQGRRKKMKRIFYVFFLLPGGEGESCRQVLHSHEEKSVRRRYETVREGRREST